MNKKKIIIAGAIGAGVAYYLLRKVKTETHVPIAEIEKIQTDKKISKIPNHMLIRYAVKSGDVDKFVKSINYLKNKYGKHIDRIAKEVGIDAAYIYAFNLIEAPKHVFKNPENVVSRAGAVGLMQLSPNAATDQIIMYKKIWGNVPSILIEKLNEKGKSCILKLKYAGQYKDPKYRKCKLSKSDLFDPVLNLTAGAMYLKNLIYHYFSPDQLHNVIYAYNFIPVFSKKAARKRMKKYPTPEAMLTKRGVPGETKAYIVRMMFGENPVIKIVNDYV